MNIKTFFDYQQIPTNRDCTVVQPDNNLEGGIRVCNFYKGTPISEPELFCLTDTPDVLASIPLMENVFVTGDAKQNFETIIRMRNLYKESNCDINRYSEVLQRETKADCCYLTYDNCEDEDEDNDNDWEEFE